MIPIHVLGNLSFENLGGYEVPSPYLQRLKDTFVGWEEYATNDKFKKCVAINYLKNAIH